VSFVERGSLMWSEIEGVINSIPDPCSVAAHSPMGLVEMGLLEQLEIDDEGEVTVRLRLTSPSCLQVGYFSHEITDRVGALEGVTSVVVTHDLGLDWSPDMIAPKAAAARHLKLVSMGAIR